MLELEVPKRAQYIRVMFDEITRLLNHLMWLGTHALDVGAMSMFLYAFRERENLIDVYEAVSGSRMHATYYRVGGVYRDLPDEMPQYLANDKRSDKELEAMNLDRNGSLLDFIASFADEFENSLEQYVGLLTDNRIWKQRLVNIGIVSKKRAKQLGFTGPMLRGSGINWDLRKKQPYAVYNELDFDIPIGTTGDSYDRYLVRMEEMKQSNHIIKQCVNWLQNNQGKVIADDHRITPPNRQTMKNDMEAMISHFKLFTEGYHLPKGEVYTAVEHPKGEFGIYLISDGANKPYRIKIRTAGFPHLAAMDEMAKGHMLSDVVTIIGTMDIVFGEIDR
jgi:NADH-quinone oxidoreductase subunit D